jgi:hypothetical protein
MTTPGMQGEVSPESMGKTASSTVGEPAQRETGHFRNYWEHCGTKSAKALHWKAVRAVERAGIGQSKRKIPAHMPCSQIIREGASCSESMLT